MKALVVYDSANGDADKVAEAMCSGMKQMGIAAECKPAGSVTPGDIQGAEVLIVGSPNGFLAGRKALKAIKGAAGKSGIKGFAFETRMPNAAPGSVEKIAAAMKASGIELLDTTYFTLNANKALMDGEKDMAVAFGRGLPNRL
ncbi:hypothetical protein AOA80_09885 [Methanomassiliicoccales archaeon RumEn M1]|jgi:flavorubredoxin|nr:hypothetical protein AOA80_09885 [Methanomassiliicoccales archaeon RumEn M1]